MRLRVLDDDRPGYAQLLFDGPLSQPQLAVSVRSAREGAFLGPDGNWQKAAHFFTAGRIEGDATSTRYRVGPEIVNFLLELDIVEFAAADGSFNLETTWENAVPQLSREHRRHQIYRGDTEETPHIRAISPGVPPRPVEPGPQPEPEPEAASKSEPVTPPPPPIATPPRIEKTAAEDSAPPPITPPPVTPPPPVAPASSGRGFFKQYGTLLLTALGGLIFVALAWGIIQILPCEWKGGQCANDHDAAERAQLCFADRKDSGRDCDISKDCVAPYLASFPNGPTARDLAAKGKAADETCRQMDERARAVFQCIADLKAQHRSRCDVQAACIQSFQALYSRGPRWADVDGAAKQAEADCRNSRGEEAALRGARQCRGEPARRCAAPGCYAAYLSSYGFNGAHKEEAQREAASLEQECNAGKSEPEDAALAGARQCAKSARRCAAPGCYAAYLNTYGSNGVHKDDAQREAASLEQECNPGKTEPEDAMLAGARQCAKSARRCATPRCYAGYFTQFGTTGKHRIDAQAEAAQLDVDCNNSARDTPQEETVWASARSCVVGAVPCAIKPCYKPYLDQFGNGRHSEQARAEVAQAERICARR